MTPKQKLQLEQSEKRQKINDLLAKESVTDEERAELDALTKRMQEIEPELRAAIVAEGEEEQRAAAQFGEGLDTEARERLALRSKASLTSYLRAAMSGKQVAGAEAELREAAGVDGIPVELWDVPDPRRAERRAGMEHRQDAATGSPATVGVNLDTIKPAVFAESIAPMLGIEMPRVMSGTFASATIETSLTAGAHGRGDAAEATAATFALSTATPKRVSARLSVRIEDVAAVGAADFEASLRENLGVVLSAALDDQAINGDGTGDNLTGMFARLTDPAAPAAGVATFDTFVAAFADGIDGLWAKRAREISVICGSATMTLSEKTFRDRVIDEANKGAASLGSVSFASYAEANYGGWSTNKRMPAAAANIQQAILHRMGRTGLRTAVCPHWGEIGIDDIYSGSAKGERYLTLHVLLGDVILVQPDAYAQVAFRVSA